MKNLILLLVLVFLYGPTAQAQITRGASPSEIYISTDSYMDNTGILHRVIFCSTDNGENLTFQYETTYNPPQGEMKIGRVLGDATPGALYNYGNNELWVSFDYGESWEYKETYGSGKFASGCINGEIYKCCVNPQGTIWRSIDYGNEFVEVTEDAKYILEVGNSLGNLFGFDGSPGVGFNLHFSIDYGQAFTEIPIDSTVAFWQVSGKYPEISRGTQPGELYLVSWWPDYHYKIFHSTDTGYTWTSKYESDYINLYYWGVQYTAGRQPGSFFVKRSRLDPTSSHTMLYIDYSNDYGETFTTYFHDLDSLYTSLTPIIKLDIKLYGYPNPFSEKTTIVFELPEDCKTPVLNICNIHGKVIRQYSITRKKSQQWDGRDGNGNLVPNGIYLYNINYENIFSQFNKLLFIK